MAETAAEDDKPQGLNGLPPRRKTMLANYTRQSKLAAFGLGGVGFLSLLSLLFTLLSANDGGPEAGKRHAPKVHGADSTNLPSPATKLNQTSAATDSPNTVPNTAGAAIHAAPQTVEELNQQDDRTIPMTQAPDPDVTENTPMGDMPRISEDGRQPWQVYSRPFNINDKRPRLAIVIPGLGLQRGITEAATRLPANVTLAFDVQSQAIGAWCAKARQDGHEILLSVPMEPFDYPHSDPGPHTLLTTLSSISNLERLDWALRQATGYVGITTLSGSHFTTDTDHFKPVMQILKQRGLMILDAHIAPHSVVADMAKDLHVPAVTANERIEDNLSPEAIDAALQQLEQAARLNGKAVGIIAPLPIALDRLQVWLKTLPQEGIALAPVSAVVQ